MLSNLDFLLDKSWAESYFSKRFVGAKILGLKRSETFNTESFNVLYSLETNDGNKMIRLSASTQGERKPTYDILKYIFENDFEIGDVLVPRPIGFDPEINAFMYEDVSGHTFMFDLNRSINWLETKINQIAGGLKKFHDIPRPSSKIWGHEWGEHEWGINRTVMRSFYPRLADNVDNIKKSILAQLAENKKNNLCHGDFQPNNLIFSNEQLYILDFGLACRGDRELDVASFVVQLKIMLRKYGDVSNFPRLSDIFLRSYGEFDTRKVKLYSVLLSLRILDYFMVFPDSENNRERIPFGYELVKKNLANISVYVDET